MAHNIEFNEQKGTWSFVSKREKAWHGLGSVEVDALTVEDAIEKANLDYEVEKVETYIRVNRKQVPTGHFVTKRADNDEILGNVGANYTVMQNPEAFDFFNYVVGESEAIIETAGVLGKGEQVFMTAKLPAHIEVGDDHIDDYLLISNSHDGSFALNVMFTPVRVVCNNTLNMAMQGAKNKVSIRHTKNAAHYLKMAKETLGIHDKYASELQAALNGLTKQKMSTTQFNDFVLQLMAKPADYAAYKDGGSLEDFHAKTLQTVDTLTQYYHDGFGQDTKECKGTRYGALNAITGYFQNVKEYQHDKIRFRQLLIGHNHITMEKAFKMLTA